MTHCGHPCLPLGYRGLGQVFFFFFFKPSSIFLLFFKINLLKKHYYRKISNPLLAFYFFFKTRKYILTKGPTFAGLARPFLTQTAELQDGEGHPRASVGGGVSSHQLMALSSLCCIALQPTTHSASEVCFPGVTWAVETCLRGEKKTWEAVKETVHKNMANLKYSNIVLG